MITKPKMIEYFEKGKQENYFYDKETDSIVRDDNDFKMSMDEYLELYQKKTGQSFKCICDVHLEDWSLLRCTECGTIIRYRYDEEYDPNFQCPTCTGYKTHFKYYTKEEIDNSNELQAVIKMYEELNTFEKEQYNRQKARNGLQDWELAVKKLYFNNIGFIIALEIDNITNKNKLKGLKLKIQKLKKEERHCWIYDKSMVIPLSFENLCYHLFYKPYFKKHPEQSFIAQLKGKSLYESMEDMAKIATLGHKK